MTDTIMMIVDTLERVERLRCGLVAKRNAVADAQAAVASAGWNQSAAKRKVREAEEALAAQETEIADLLRSIGYQSSSTGGTENAGLPEVREESTRWLYGRVAELRVARSRHEKRVAAAEKTLEEATAEAEKDSWKWKARAAAGGAEPKALTAARDAVAAAKKEMRAFEEESAEIMEMFDAHMTAARERAEVNAWAAGGYEGERPECIERAAREFAAEMEEGCERIPLPRKRRYVAITCGPPVEIEETDPVLAPGEWGTPMTAEQYLNQLVPPPPEPAKEEFRASTKGGTPAWIKRFLEAKKARKAATVAVA